MRFTKQIALILAIVFISSGCFAFTTLAQRLMSVTGGGGGYTGPGDVVGGASAFISTRSWNTAYATGSNKSATTVTNLTTTEHCDFFIATNGNFGVATACSGSSGGSTASAFCSAGGGPCAVHTAVDQTGSGNDGNQTVAGQQPGLDLSSSPFSGFTNSFDFVSANFSVFDFGATVATSTFTWVMWVNVNSTSGTNGLCNSNNASGNGADLRIDAGGALDLKSAGAANLGTSTGTITGAAWHQIAVSFDNSIGKAAFYIDGSPSGTTTTSPVTFTLTHMICGFAFGGGFDGKIAEFTMYNSVLTPTNISDLFSNPSP